MFSLSLSHSVIGLSDGLTVPFALTAGLAGLGNSKVVVLGGVAELIAGTISMGCGAFRECLVILLASHLMRPSHLMRRLTGRRGKSFLVLPKLQVLIHIL